MLRSKNEEQPLIMLPSLHLNCCLMSKDEVHQQCFQHSHCHETSIGIMTGTVAK